MRASTRTGQSPDESSSSDDNENGFSTRKKGTNVLPINYLLKRTRKLINTGLHKITLQDTSKGVAVVLDSLNDAIARFEALETSLVQNDEKRSVRETGYADSKLSELRNKLLVENERLNRNLELALHEERIVQMRSQFRMSLLTIAACGWCTVIGAAPLDFSLKTFFIAITLSTVAYFGEKYVSMKEEVMSKGFNAVSREAFLSADEICEDLNSMVRQVRLQSRYDDCISRSVEVDRKLSVEKSKIPVSTENNIAVEEEDEVPEQIKKEKSKGKKKKGELVFSADLDEPCGSNLDHEVKLGMSFNFLQDSGIAFSSVFDKLTEEEKTKFNIFKTLALEKIAHSKDIDHTRPYDKPDDFNLLRFLQSDKFNEQLAVRRIVSTISWRQKSGIQKYPLTRPKSLEKYKTLRPRHILGNALDGMPVVYEDVGKFCSHKEVPKGLSMEEWLKCYSYESHELFHEFRKTSIANERVIHKFIYIADLGKTKFSHVRKFSLITTLKNEVEVHFPECAGKIYIINAPGFLAGVWKVISKMLDPVVVQKIKIFSKVPTKELLEDLGEETVPVAFGGKNPIEI